MAEEKYDRPIKIDELLDRAKLTQTERQSGPPANCGPVIPPLIPPNLTPYRVSPVEPSQKDLFDQARSIQNNLVDQMALYGIVREKAEVQVQALVDAVRRLAERELY